MEEPRPHPLTGAGKILFVVTLLLGCGLSYTVFVVIVERLPAGNYPRFFFLAPIGITLALFFFGVSWILRSRGVATFTSEVDEVRESHRRRMSRARGDDRNVP